MPHESAEGALPDAGDDSELEDAAAFASVDGASQATGHDNQRAAAAQQLHALRVVAAPTLQRREFKRARRQREPQLGRQLQVMRAHAAGGEEAAGGGGTKNKVQDGEDLCKAWENLPLM